MSKCSLCDEKAEYILVNYWHEIVNENEFFCEDHAFENDREKCRFCDDYLVRVDDDGAGDEIKLLPTYVAGALGSKGCCSEHP